MEEEILHTTRDLERKLLEEAAQKKADQSPPGCPVCGHNRCTRDHQRTFQSRFGAGDGQAAARLVSALPGMALSGRPRPGLERDRRRLACGAGNGRADGEQMPVQEASAVIARLTGVKLPPATLDREARPQGQRADKKRAQLDEQMRAGPGAEPMLPLPQAPFTLVIELDAWNLREGDDWGQSALKRAAGQEPSRWHWVYGGTGFRLDQRVQSDGGRARLLSRGTVMTRGGVDDLREQLFAEAQRHGLAQAAKGLVVAEGAVWIWNLTGDRLAQAQQRLAYYHASQHLWAVAHALHPEAEAAARAWLAPLL